MKKNITTMSEHFQKSNRKIKEANFITLTLKYMNTPFALAWHRYFNDKWRG